MTSGSKLSSSENIALKAISGVGLAIFTALMVVHWNNVLSKVEVAEETPPPATPSTTTNAAAAPPVPSTSGVAPSATATSAIATTPTTATPSTPVSSATAPITTTPTTPAVTAPAPATPTTSTPVATAPAAPSPIAAAPSTPVATAATSNFDAAQLESLELQLYDTLDKGWTSYPSFGQDLVYKVTVDADGKIVNYQPLHDAAVDYLNETPLDEVTPNSAATGADFVVVMTPTGILEVDSWIGQ